ncbi:MAG: hypothetical protein HLUCCO17_13975 [Saliniramus fredricksonii]|uniref:Uncharacterized protein n=2 Tax=Saliniramus fredricksonii TaxID=1653334 RepID=A0A0P7XZP0_9HYPH|nr:MAG: hypothetical protein HLUCCO17_13975 [Saliniramus fredricksonii]SCC78422.1 hypothetical protein GA0071312_0276 [Saliniramus fredricksonii]
MVSIDQSIFSPHSPHRQMNGPDEAPFGLPGSTGKELSGPVSDQHLAFVGPGERATNPNLFHGLLNLLEAGARLTGALAGYATGIGSQLLEQLVSNPTADTRELVRIIRDLEARGLDIDSAVALRELPNGDMGVYAIRDPDDPFPELLATINGQTGEITAQQPASDPSDRLEWNPDDRPDLTWQGLGVRGDGWPLDEMPPIDFPPMDPRPRFDTADWERQFPERWDNFSRDTRTFSEDAASFFDPKTRVFAGGGDFNVSGAPELPGSTPLHGGSAQNDDAVERLMEALEAARRITLDPGGFFGNGVDPRDAMYERYGYIGLFAYDVVQAQNSPQDGSGGTAAAAGASAAVANYLRVLPAEIAAAIVNNLADRLGTVPDLYRDALAQALEKGDPEDPAIQRARQLLSEAGAADDAPADALPALTPDEEAIVTREIRAGTFTREVFDAFREANPDMPVVELVIELSMLMQGYDSQLNMPDLYGQTSEAGAPVNIRVFGADPALDARTIEELDRLIALGESGVPLDPRTEAAVMIADQIRKNLDTIDQALVITDAQGQPLGMMVYTTYPNPDDPTGPRVLFIEDIVSFAPGQGIGLKLLQEGFARSEGILELISLPGAEEYYLSLGAEIVPPDPDAPFATNFYPHLRWTDRPERRDDDAGGASSTQGAPAPAQATGGTGTVRQYGQDPALDAALMQMLEQEIAMGDPTDPDVTEYETDRAEIAAQIMTSLRGNGSDGALVRMDDDGRPTGVLLYSRIAHPDESGRPSTLIVDDVISFSPGAGLALLQEAYDRSEGFMMLYALPGALPAYLRYGAQERSASPENNQQLPADFRDSDDPMLLFWRQRPQRAEQGQ